MSKSSKNSNTTRFVKIVSPLAVAIALAACGGDSGFGNKSSTEAGTDGGNTGNKTQTVVSIDIIPDSFNLLKNGSKPITIKAIAKDSKNNAISNAKYEYTVDHGATLIVDPKGQATLTPGSSTKVGDELTITVKSGNKTVKMAQKIKVILQQEEVQKGEKVASLVLRRASQELYSDGSNSIEITAVPKNADNVSISAEVKFKAAGPATLEVNGNTVEVSLTNKAKLGDKITISAESGGKKADDFVITVVKKEERDGAKVASIDLNLDSTELFDDGTKAISIEAFAKDSKSNVISNASYEFVVVNKTDATRTATLVVNGNKATLSRGKALENDVLEVKVISGGKEIAKTVTVVKPPVEEVEPVASIAYQADSAELLVDGSKPVTITAIPKNADNISIPAKVKFSTTSETAILNVTDNTVTVIPNNAAIDEEIIIKMESDGKEITHTLTVVKPASNEIVAAAISVAASSRELPSDGTKPVTISVVTKDKNNNLLKGAEVSFSVDGNANLEVNPSTGAVHTAILTPGSAENRTLKVTVTSGTQTEDIIVEVVGTTLVVDGPEAITFNEEAGFVLKLKDSGNKPLAYKDVTLVSATGNTLNAPIQTNEKGEVEFTLTGNIGGNDTITATALGASVTKDVKVSGDLFTLTGNLDDVHVGVDNELTILWENNGTPKAGETISINATRGVLSTSSVTTDADGKATFTISSPKAGQTIVTVTTSDGLSTSLKGEFVATTPAYINTQADPTLINPKGTSTVVAKIRDLADNPVKNKTIIFNLEDTVNGTLSQGSAITDSLGRATVSYTAGDASSAKDGVVIKTYVQSAPTIADEIKLTVGGKALRIVLGHDHLVAADEIFYTKTYGVIVTDSAGNPIKDQNIDFTITPTQYYKGRLIYTENGDDKQWVRSLTATCPSEDFDNDGNLDDGEDANGNGKLEPTHDAAVTGSGVTDENGKITVQVVYPKSRAWWSDQAIEASTTVGGTEYLERTEFTLPVLAADVKSENPPPNSVSPYGTWGSCSDDPAGTPPVVTPTPAPPVVRIIESASKVIVGSVQNSTTTVKWYAVTIDGKRAVPNLDYTINDSGKVGVQMGNNNDFKLTDNNITVDDSGFYLSINTIKTDDRPLTTSLPVYYQDDAGSTQSYNITLNGGYDGKATTITLNVGETYVEYGATAKSLITDEDLGVKSYGSVDTTVAGTTVIVYVAVDESGKTVTTTRTVVVKDSDIPVITLIGGDISLSVGTPLPIDGSLSATAVDTSDGDLSGSIVIDSTNVNTSTVGTYYIYYSVTDINGNTAVARRTVTVQ